jgi:hypothetical protein
MAANGRPVNGLATVTVLCVDVGAILNQRLCTPQMSATHGTMQWSAIACTLRIYVLAILNEIIDVDVLSVRRRLVQSCIDWHAVYDGIYRLDGDKSTTKSSGGLVVKARVWSCGRA